jgi:integration host factor subunit alpha
MVIILLSWGANISLSCNVRRVFMTLTKADIAKKIADDCGFMKGEATEVFEKLLEIIKARLITGEDVMISGFGKWSAKSKHARQGRNPKTGEKMILDARRVVTWKYSPVLKKEVNSRSTQASSSPSSVPEP